MLRSKSICNEISVFFHSYFLFSKLRIICKRPKVNMGWYKELRDKSKYINKDVHVFQMKTAHIESVANRQSRRCYVGIPMDEDRNINARIVQRCRYCANIPMDEFRNFVCCNDATPLVLCRYSNGWISQYECSHFATRYELCFW